MNSTMWIRCTILCLTIAGLMSMKMLTDQPTPAYAAEAKKSAEKPKPVEDDMHEFMEYVFQPTFKRLKAAMATSPKDRSTWKTVKADSLILAEGGNLLLFRAPQADSALWQQYSVAVRKLGGKVYQAAKKKDESAAGQHYKAMVTQCNLCHQKFADGKHQLEP